MESSDRHPLEGNVEICKFTIGSKKRIGKNKAKETSRLIVIGIEKKAKGVSRIYARKYPGYLIQRLKILKRIKFQMIVFNKNEDK